MNNCWQQITNLWVEKLCYTVQALYKLSTEKTSFKNWKIDLNPFCLKLWTTKLKEIAAKAHTWLQHSRMHQPRQQMSSDERKQVFCHASYTSGEICEKVLVMTLWWSQFYLRLCLSSTSACAWHNAVMLLHCHCDKYCSLFYCCTCWLHIYA